MNAPLILPKLDAVTERLGKLVAAVEDRLIQPCVSKGYDNVQEAWPEAIELARSIEQDEGWILYVSARGKDWERLVLYLDAPNLYLRSYWRNVDVTPYRAWWSSSMIGMVSDAKKKRFKERCKETPDYTTDVLTNMRERRWARWGQP
jgi:hypothetical protein